MKFTTKLSLDVMGGIRAEPTAEELISELPVFSV